MCQPCLCRWFYSRCKPRLIHPQIHRGPPWAPEERIVVPSPPRRMPSSSLRASSPVAILTPVCVCQFPPLQTLLPPMPLGLLCMWASSLGLQGCLSGISKAPLVWMPACWPAVFPRMSTLRDLRNSPTVLLPFTNPEAQGDGGCEGHLREDPGCCCPRASFL